MKLVKSESLNVKGGGFWTAYFTLYVKERDVQYQNRGGTLPPTGGSLLWSQETQKGDGEASSGPPPPHHHHHRELAGGSTEAGEELPSQQTRGLGLDCSSHSRLEREQMKLVNVGRWRYLRPEWHMHVFGWGWASGRLQVLRLARLKRFYTSFYFLFFKQKRKPTFHPPPLLPKLSRALTPRKVSPPFGESDT